jgi:signal transduction histidine kinase
MLGRGFGLAHKEAVYVAPMILCGIVALVAVGGALYGLHVFVRDVHALSERVRSADPGEVRTLLSLKKPFAAGTMETAEISSALRLFAGHVEQMASRHSDESVRTAQEMRESNKTLSDFMYYIAHTLRTPLNAIRWSVETLKNEDAGSVNEEQREMLDKLEASAVKLTSLASELQDALIVLRGEPLRMRPEEGDMAGLIDEAAGRWAVPVRRKGFTLDWKRPLVAKPFKADPARIAQVLDVLFDNAVRYSRDAGSVITARLLFVDGTEAATDRRAWNVPPNIDQAVIVMIRDEGIGIATDERTHVFDPFFRGTQAREMWVDGKGLGLTIVKAITQGMGGDVWFTSAKNKGTSMYVAIPLA